MLPTKLSFEEFMMLHKNPAIITEQSKAMRGDWSGGFDFIRAVTQESIDDRYDDVETFTFDSIPDTQFNLKLKRNTAEYILGYSSSREVMTKIGPKKETRFRIVCMIQFSKESSLGHKLGNNKLYNVDAISTIDEEEFRRVGIASKLYKYFVIDRGWSLLGDKHQYYGARKLWSKLSQDLDLIVDIVDIDKKQTIFKDVTLHHGKYDEDFDHRLWSYEDDKTHLRPLLKVIQ
jgi:hypothetical protein